MQLLKRTIGEDIHIQLKLNQQLISADPSMIEKSLLSCGKFS